MKTNDSRLVIMYLYNVSEYKWSEYQYKYYYLKFVLEYYSSTSTCTKYYNSAVCRLQLQNTCIISLCYCECPMSCSL